MDFSEKQGKYEKKFVLKYKIKVLDDGNVFGLCKKHVKLRIKVKNMTNLKKNIAQSFIT